MALYRTRAIVLRTRNFGEADRIAVLFSEELGKFEAVVKGARRQRSRFVGNTLAFNYIQAMLLTGKSLDTLSQAELVHSFAKLHEDLTKFAYASFWVELVDGFVPERQAAKDIFRFLLAAFIILEKTSDPVVLNMAFQIRLLSYLGYQPQIDQCISCHQVLTEPCFFSAQAGGAVCSACSGKFRDLIKVGLADLQIMEHLGAVDLRELGTFAVLPESFKVVQGILRNFIEVRLERPLKSQMFLDSLSL
ncbi:MAG TPA: DNA repair protein RecO [Firmicutes bacterium]|nr:DNA repair protein RecO [Bacillota bacterium]